MLPHIDQLLKEVKSAATVDESLRSVFANIKTYLNEPNPTEEKFNLLFEQLEVSAPEITDALLSNPRRLIPADERLDRNDTRTAQQRAIDRKSNQ
jgi:hypothetical protein